MIVTLPASPWPYRILNAALLALLAWFAAGVVWWLLGPKPSAPVAAPAPLAAAPTSSQDLSSLVALFARPTSPAAVAQAPSSLNYKLRGVIAATGKQPAAAILQGSAPVALVIKLGDELEAGVTLTSVAPDHLMLDNRGKPERLELDAKPAATLDQGASVASGGPSIPSPAMRLAITPPNDERVLSRQQLAAGMQSLNVADWSKGLIDAPGGGILVENPTAQPIAPMLGLQGGDVLKSVNGALMNKTNDISMLYGAFTRETLVNVSLIRNATVMQFKFRILK